MPEGKRALSLEREQRAWELSVQGWSQREIAAELGVSQPAVWKMLKKAGRRFIGQFTERVSAHTVKQFDRLEFIIAESLAGWATSKQPTKRSRKKTQLQPGGKDLPGFEEQIQEAVTTSGDTGHLRAAITAIAEENTLLGLHAPKKIDVLDKRRPLEKLSDEELKKQIAADVAELEAME